MLKKENLEMDSVNSIITRMLFEFETEKKKRREENNKKVIEI